MELRSNPETLCAVRARWRSLTERLDSPSGVPAVVLGSTSVTNIIRIGYAATRRPIEVTFQPHPDFSCGKNWGSARDRAEDRARKWTRKFADARLGVKPGVGLHSSEGMMR